MWLTKGIWNDWNAFIGNWKNLIPTEFLNSPHADNEELDVMFIWVEFPNNLRRIKIKFVDKAKRNEIVIEIEILEKNKQHLSSREKWLMVWYEMWNLKLNN